MNDESDDIKIAMHSVDQAQALIELGRYEQAIPFLSKAIASNPDDDVLYCKLADAYHYVNDYEKSLDLAKTALHLNPNSDYAHFRLAWNYLMTNHFDGALKHARAAIKIDPDDGPNLYTLAWCEYHSGNSRQSLKAAERAIELNPDDADLKGLLADLTFSFGKYKQSEKYYREALRNNPESARIHCYLGLSLAALHNVHEAVEHLLAAVKIEPNNDTYRDHLFNLIHHDIMALSKSSSEAALSDFEPVVYKFYQDYLKRTGWTGKLRFTSIVTLWLCLLLLLMLFFTWITGDDVRKILDFAFFVAALYILLFILQFVINAIRMSKFRKYQKGKRG